MELRFQSCFELRGNSEVKLNSNSKSQGKAKVQLKGKVTSDSVSSSNRALSSVPPQRHDQHQAMYCTPKCTNQSENSSKKSCRSQLHFQSLANICKTIEVQHNPANRQRALFKVKLIFCLCHIWVAYLRQKILKTLPFKDNSGKFHKLIPGAIGGGGLRESGIPAKDPSRIWKKNIYLIQKS